MVKQKFVRPIDLGLDFIKMLKPAKWDYEAPLNDGREHFGFVAQDVNEIVSKEDYNFVSMKEGFYSINYWEFIGPMVKAIQELEEKVERLENEKQQIQEANGKDKKTDEGKGKWWSPIRYFSN